MTPAARAAAAIAVLDEVLAGRSVEAAMTAWGRRHRFAGSGDRSAIRDIVYDATRRRRSLAAWGGAMTGRGLALGAERAAARDPAGTFGAGRHAPPPLLAAEADQPHGPWPEPVELDCPDFALPLLRRATGVRLPRILRLMQQRAQVHVRVNVARTTGDEVVRLLARDGIRALRHPLATSALVVLEGARRLRQTDAFVKGLIELQDAASQAVAEAVPIRPGTRVLDFCAGAGGKTLAMAARVEAEYFVHDIDAGRMRDLPGRAARAGCTVQVLPPGAADAAAPYDVVLVDAPCSGSGAWRRDPEAKWALTPERLEDLRRLQADILDEAAPLVAEDGMLGYATCSLLLEENAWQVAAFRRRHRGWCVSRTLALTLLDGGDGFYLALLSR